ncbi:MAG: hypothetical protein AB7U73_14750, partial [Pirellulales bacterium]
ALDAMRFEQTANLAAKDFQAAGHFLGMISVDGHRLGRTGGHAGKARQHCAKRRATCGAAKSKLNCCHHSYLARL